MSATPAAARSAAATGASPSSSAAANSAVNMSPAPMVSAAGGHPDGRGVAGAPDIRSVLAVGDEDDRHPGPCEVRGVEPAEQRLGLRVRELDHVDAGEPHGVERPGGTDDAEAGSGEALRVHHDASAGPQQRPQRVGSDVVAPLRADHDRRCGVERGGGPALDVGRGEGRAERRDLVVAAPVGPQHEPADEGRVGRSGEHRQPGRRDVAVQLVRAAGDHDSVDAGGAQRPGREDGSAARAHLRAPIRVGDLVTHRLPEQRDHGRRARQAR